MNPLIQLKTTALPLFTALALTCLGLVPNARATDTDGALAVATTPMALGFSLA